MTVIKATVLDPLHLELAKPLRLRTGSQISVTVGEPDAEPSAALDPPGFRQREQEWCRTHGDVLRRYSGEWVVVEGEEVIAHGDDPVPLVKEARERGIRSPYVFFVEPVQPGVVKIGI